MPEEVPWPHPYRKLPESPTGSSFRHSRGYLPHFKIDACIQMITYRLADSLPFGVVEKLLEKTLPSKRNAEYRKRLENYLDAGYGACWLRRAENAELVLDTWLHFNCQRYNLHAWVIMPNHVHLILEVISPYTLPNIVKSWKAYTASQINRRLGRKGPVWQREYWDRVIRDQHHYGAALNYIYENPVKAGLVAQIEDWRWSSWNAGFGTEEK
jgi:REP element-mobilizing transposase RayT